FCVGDEQSGDASAISGHQPDVSGTGLPPDRVQHLIRTEPRDLIVHIPRFRNQALLSRAEIEDGRLPPAVALLPLECDSAIVWGERRTFDVLAHDGDGALVDVAPDQELAAAGR